MRADADFFKTPNFALAPRDQMSGVSPLIWM
jgi:hypothetical protein